MNENTLMKVANGLSANIQCLKNPGLLHGKMGATIFLYHYARYSGCSVYSDLADYQMKEIFIARHNLPGSFVNGMSGIGWGIHYLIREEFINGKENILADIENRFYSIIQQYANEDMLDVGLYFACCRPGLLNELLSSMLAKQITGLLSSGCHALGILNKVMALTLHMPIHNVHPYEKMLFSAFLYAIEAQLFRLSDLICCKDILKAFGEKSANNVWDKLSGRCEIILQDRDLRKDRLETVWQHLVFLDGKNPTGFDMEWTTALVSKILNDLNEPDLFLSCGLPAVGLDMLLNCVNEILPMNGRFP